MLPIAPVSISEASTKSVGKDLFETEYFIRMLVLLDIVVFCKLFFLLLFIFSLNLIIFMSSSEEFNFYICLMKKHVKLKLFFVVFVNAIIFNNMQSKQLLQICHKNQLSTKSWTGNLNKNELLKLFSSFYATRNKITCANYKPIKFSVFQFYYSPKKEPK